VNSETLACPAAEPDPPKFEPPKFDLAKLSHGECVLLYEMLKHVAAESEPITVALVQHMARRERQAARGRTVARRKRRGVLA
jgi:hypothetical protein